MGFSIKAILMLIGMVACLSSVAYAITGIATYYGPPIVPSACYGYQDNGNLVLAANPNLYGGGAVCGRMYNVRCTGPAGACRGGSVTVKAVDLCPGCAGNQVDLSQDAFATIGDLNAGVINIEYNQV